MHGDPPAPFRLRAARVGADLDRPLVGWAGPRHSSGRHPRVGWAAASLALLLFGTSFLLAGLRQPDAALGGVLDSRLLTAKPRHTPQLAGPTAPPQGAGASASVRPAATRVPHSTPVRLIIPAIDLDASLIKLGQHTDGTVEVPSNPALPGWYSLGPTPGQQGSAVILGHVDSSEGPAVFYFLSTLTAGDAIVVVLRNGSVAHFVVGSSVTYANAEFPNGRVYTPHGYAGLQLVTCGGGFDTVAGHYLGNVVVYTRLVRLTPPDPPEAASSDARGTRAG